MTLMIRQPYTILNVRHQDTAAAIMEAIHYEVDRSATGTYNEAKHELKVQHGTGVDVQPLADLLITNIAAFAERYADSDDLADWFEGATALVDAQLAADLWHLWHGQGVDLRTYHHAQRSLTIIEPEDEANNNNNNNNKENN